MILEIFEDEHGPVGDRVLQEAQITTTRERPLHVLITFKVGQDVLGYELLVSASGIKDVSGCGYASNISCWIPTLLDRRGMAELPWIEEFAE